MASKLPEDRLLQLPPVLEFFLPVERYTQETYTYTHVRPTHRGIGNFIRILRYVQQVSRPSEYIVCAIVYYSRTRELDTFAQFERFSRHYLDSAFYLYRGRFSKTSGTEFHPRDSNC